MAGGVQNTRRVMAGVGQALPPSAPLPSSAPAPTTSTVRFWGPQLYYTTDELQTKAGRTKALIESLLNDVTVHLKSMGGGDITKGLATAPSDMKQFVSEYRAFAAEFSNFYDTLGDVAASSVHQWFEIDNFYARYLQYRKRWEAFGLPASMSLPGPDKTIGPSEPIGPIIGANIAKTGAGIASGLGAIVPYALLGLVGYLLLSRGGGGATTVVVPASAPASAPGAAQSEAGTLGPRTTEILTASESSPASAPAARRAGSNIRRFARA